VQSLHRFDKNTDIRAPLEKEGEFFGELISYSIAELGIVADQCNPHERPLRGPETC
jgi:hypothetical protein